MKDFLNSQISAVDKLSKTKVGALFMEAGTGKTRATIELIKSTDTDFVLWFTPFQTKDHILYKNKLKREDKIIKKWMTAL